MTIDFKESKTRVNLMRAFAGESQARNRYTIAADTVRKQGLYSVAQVFLFTADQEKAHAERYYDLLKDLSGTTIDISGGYPVDQFESAVELLKKAKHNELEEADDVYQAFGNEAKAEGFMAAAAAFFQIAEIEAIHARRFGKLAELIEQNKYFESDSSGKWMCMNCGHIQEGKTVPAVCPVCRYEQGYFIPVEIAPYLGFDFLVK